MEFAVIKTGGKQYRVSQDTVFRTEKLKGDSKNPYKKGDEVVFDKVLLVDDGTNTSIGAPYLDGAKVTGIIQKIGRAQKVIVLKYKAKSNYRKKNGHRQPFFEIKITKIS
jgi:large subunit ribosomal protein L21